MQLDEPAINGNLFPIVGLPRKFKMTHELAAPGLIFISHSSADKPFVESVIRKIPKSHLFYDIDTINPGSHTVDALDDGLFKCSVFAMFVSKNTKESCWVDYETGVAEVEKIKRRQIKIVAIPIGEASYKDAPEWMRKYMAVPPGYSASDIARLLKYLYEDALRAQGVLNESPFIGRENLCNNIILQSRTKPAETGIPLNFVILAGIQSMGRFSVAKKVIPKIFPGARNDLPVFDLPRHADAVDLFIALRQDITGIMEPAWTKEQISAFPSDPQDQATTILGSLSHFAKINQTVIIKSSFGLRDQSRTLKPWLECLFILLRNEIDVRVVWISERLLPPESINTHHNVIQFHVSELLEEQIVFLLTELLSVSDSSPTALKRIAPHVHGHPGSAHYVANLVRSAQRGPESLLDRPEAIRMFQERCVEGILSEEVIGALGKEIVSLLKIMQWADYELISKVFGKNDCREIADVLWFMTDNCIISYNMTNGYKLAEIVRGVSNNSNDELSPEVLDELAKVLSERLNNKDTNISALEAIVFVKIRMGGVLPEELRNILTAATLLDLVEQYYRAGHRFDAEYKKILKLLQTYLFLQKIC
ncbi:toll/interleukin-1 receptor domain-containing protein [Magnetospirillum fulvum]|nr:toll/interleukin-1 receptor domain-containing protein [Magnetospirillum fulvum]